MATFSGLTLTKAASGYTIVVSSTGLNSATTTAITVTPAAASQVLITQQPPASVTANKGFGLQATIEDAYGNLETGDNAAVTVALANNPGGATLGGTLSVDASQGVATFAGLTLDAVGVRLHAASLQRRPHRRNHQPHHRDPRARHEAGDHAAASISRCRGHNFQPDRPGRGRFGRPCLHVHTARVTVALASNPSGATLGGTLTRDCIRRRRQLLRTDADQARIRLHASSSPAAASTARPRPPSP